MISHFDEKLRPGIQERVLVRAIPAGRTDGQIAAALRVGVAAEDNGNYLNPSSKGSLVLDPSFNMAAPESQQWLSRFCKNVRDQPFFQPMLGPLLPNWFIETFQSWMDRRCEVIAINFFFISSFHSFFYPFKKNDKKKRRPVLLARGSR